MHTTPKSSSVRNLHIAQVTTEATHKIVNHPLKKHKMICRSTCAVNQLQARLSEYPVTTRWSKDTRLGTKCVITD